MNKIISLLCCCLLFLYPVGLYAADDVAVFAGGCFWCLEHDLENLPGVIDVESGYAGGRLSNPTYRNHGGHQEVVKVYYDNEKISYDNLLRAYWRNIDPEDKKGQFCDRGDSYRPVIFSVNELQNLAAHNSFKNVSRELNLPIGNIKVELKDLEKFWIAEDYHQNFAERNSIKYNFYRYSCGRDARLKEVWGSDINAMDQWRIGNSD